MKKIYWFFLELARMFELKKLTPGTQKVEVASADIGKVKTAINIEDIVLEGDILNFQVLKIENNKLLVGRLILGEAPTGDGGGQWKIDSKFYVELNNSLIGLDLKEGEYFHVTHEKDIIYKKGTLMPTIFLISFL